MKHSRKNTVVPRNRFPLDQGRGLSRTAEIAEISAHGAGRWAVCSDLRSLSAVSSFAHTTLSGGGGHCHRPLCTDELSDLPEVTLQRTVAPGLHQGGRCVSPSPPPPDL